MIFWKRSLAPFSVCWVDWSRLGSLLTSRRNTARGLIASHDVMAADPDLPTVPPYPVAGPPHVIRAACPISGTAIVRSIANGHYDRASSVVWAGTVIRSVITWVSGVIAFTTSSPEQG